MQQLQGYSNLRWSRIWFLVATRRWLHTHRHTTSMSRSTTSFFATGGKRNLGFKIAKMGQICNICTMAQLVCVQYATFSSQIPFYRVKWSFWSQSSGLRILVIIIPTWWRTDHARRTWLIWFKLRKPTTNLAYEFKTVKVETILLSVESRGR